MRKLSRSDSGKGMEDDKPMKHEDFVTKCVLHGTSDEVRRLSCPKCSAPLKIGVYQGVRIMSAQIKCQNCDFVVRLDGLPPAPAWVVELGSKFETTP